jgi:phosphatidylinositol-3-phosphatase
MSTSRYSAIVTVCLLLLATGCGGGSSGGGGMPPPASAKVFLVVEENHSYSDVIGNSAMPYINGLASKFAVAKQYFADTHPSIGNYFMLTTGMIESNNDAFAGMVSDDNIVRELLKAGKTWRSYAESLPSAGYLGGDTGDYLKHHNPAVYFSDVIGTPEASNVVPFAQFSSDVVSGNLPDFSFIVPNIMHDAHNGTLAAADQWLQANIDPVVTSSGFQNNGVLIIVFDESETTDSAHGGGHVPFVIVGPQVKSGLQSTTFYQHESTLRLILSTLGVTTFPGNSASAPQMGEFFK